MSKSALDQMKELWRKKETTVLWEDFEKTKMERLWMPHNSNVGPVPRTNAIVFRKLRNPGCE